MWVFLYIMYMILDNTIKLETFGNRRLNYYYKLGYDISGEFLEIKSHHLSPGSRQIVSVECDYCKTHISITFKEYKRNISINNKYACSKKCGSLKAIETNLRNNGVEYPMQSKIIMEKSRLSNIENNGVEYPMQSKIIMEKSKQTLIEKYGVEHISKTEYYKEKFKETCLKNNGVEYPMQSIDVQNKAKNTFLEKYGVDNPSKSGVVRSTIIKNNLEKYGVEYPTMLSVVKIKAVNTNLEKYGVDNPSKLDVNKIKTRLKNLEKYGVDHRMKLPETIENLKLSNLEKYGVDNPSKLDDIKEKVTLTNLKKYGYENYFNSDNFKEKSKISMVEKYGVDNISKNSYYREEKFLICKNENYVEYISNGLSKFKCDLNKDHEFKIHSDNFYHRKESNLPLCTICYPIGDQKSIKERELLEYIKFIYIGNIITSYRDGLEIDIYLPQLRIGFEFNGLYWHSEEFKDKNYHLKKTNHFKERGIRIIHIWEDDWNFRRDIIESQVKNLLKVNPVRIFARKCVVKEVDVKNVREFLDVCHVQGFTSSVKKLGLYYDNKLVSIMTFDHFEGRKIMEPNEWNLSRFCNKLNTSVIGGSSKLLNYFIKNYKPKRIVSYADKDWSVGNLYYKLGFENIGENGPDYKYIIDYKRVHKSRYKKSKLNTTLTESKFMKDSEIYKIYDCGKIKFEKIINS